jgi:urea transport system ATP-binding protein
LGIGRKFQKPTVFEKPYGLGQPGAGAEPQARGLCHAVLQPVGRRQGAHRRDPRDGHRLTHRKDELAAGLSHGQKQWLEIGMLLAQEPKLLLVDEPVAGMTDAETAETAILLKEIARDSHSVVVVEHDMGFIRELGVKVTCLH